MTKQESDALDRATYAQQAQKMWDSFTDDEKKLVRFGMFPAEKMLVAQNEGYNDGRLLAVALMDCAKRNGGMIA